MSNVTTGSSNSAYGPERSSRVKQAAGMGRNFGVTTQGHLTLPNGNTHEIEVLVGGKATGVRTLADVKKLLESQGRSSDWVKISEKLNSVMTEVFSEMDLKGDPTGREINLESLAGRVSFQKLFGEAMELISGLVARCLGSQTSSPVSTKPPNLPLADLRDHSRADKVREEVSRSSDEALPNSVDTNTADLAAAQQLKDEESKAEAQRQKQRAAKQRAALLDTMNRKKKTEQDVRLAADKAKRDASVSTLGSYFDNKLQGLKAKAKKPGISEFRKRSIQSQVRRLEAKKEELSSVRDDQMGRKSLEYFVEAWLDNESWSLVSETTGDIGWDKEMSHIVNDSNVQDGVTMDERFRDFIYSELGGADHFEDCVLGKKILAQFEGVDSPADSVLSEQWAKAKSDVGRSKSKIGGVAKGFVERRKLLEKKVRSNLENPACADRLLPNHASKEKLKGLLQSFNRLGTAEGDLASLEGDITSLERMARSIKKDIKGDERVRTGGKYNETVTVLNHIIAFSKAGQAEKVNVAADFRSSSFEAVLSTSFHKMIGSSSEYDQLKSHAKILDGEVSLPPEETKISIASKFVNGLKGAVAKQSLNEVNDPKGVIRAFSELQVEVLEEILVGEVITEGGDKVNLRGIPRDSSLPPAESHSDTNWNTDDITVRGYLRTTVDAEVTEFKDLSGANSPFGENGEVNVSRLTEILTDKGIHHDRKMSILHLAAANIADVGFAEGDGTIEDLKSSIEDMSRWDRNTVDTQKRQDCLVALFFQDSKGNVGKKAAYPMLQKHLEAKRSLTPAENRMYNEIKTAVKESNPGTEAFIQLVDSDPLLQSILFTECQKKYPDALKGGDVPNMEVTRSPEATKFHLKFTDGSLSKKDFTLQYSNSGFMAVFGRGDEEKLKKKGSWSAADIKSLLLEHEPHQATAMANALGEDSAAIRSMAESMTSPELRVESLLNFIAEIEKEPDDAGFYNSDQMELLDTLVFQDSVLEKEMGRNEGNVRALLEKFTSKAMEYNPSTKDCVHNGKDRMLYMFFARMSMQMSDRTGINTSGAGQVQESWDDFTPTVKAGDVDSRNPSKGAVLEYKTKAQLVLLQAQSLGKGASVDAGEYLDLVDNMRKLNEMRETQGELVHSYFSGMVDDAVRELEALVGSGTDVLGSVFSGEAGEKDKLLAPLLESAGSDARSIKRSNPNDWKSLGMGVFEFKTGGRNYQINVTTGETMVDGKKYSVTERKMLENETYLECFGRQKLTYQECTYQPQVREKEVLEGNLASYAEEIQNTYDEIVQEEVTQVIDVINDFIIDQKAGVEGKGGGVSRSKLHQQALRELHHAKLFSVGRDAGDDRRSSENIVNDLLDAILGRADGEPPMNIAGIKEKYVAALKTKTLAVNMSEIDEITKFDAEARMEEDYESRTQMKRGYTARISMEKRLANVKNRQRSFFRLKEARYTSEKKSLLTKFRLDKDGMNPTDFREGLKSIMKEYGHDPAGLEDELSALLTAQCPGKTLENCKLVESKFFKNGDYIIKVTPKGIDSDEVDVEIFNNSTRREESLGPMRESTTKKLSHAAQERFSAAGMRWEKLFADETEVGGETHGQKAMRRGEAMRGTGQTLAHNAGEFTASAASAFVDGFEIFSQGAVDVSNKNYWGLLKMVYAPIHGTVTGAAAVLGGLTTLSGKVTEGMGETLRDSADTIDSMARKLDVFARERHVASERARDLSELGRDFKVITSLSSDRFEAFSGVQPTKQNKKDTYQFISRSKCMDAVGEGTEKELLKGLFDQHDPPLKAWVREASTGFMGDKRIEIQLRDASGQVEYMISDGKVYKGDVTENKDLQPVLSAFEDSSDGETFTQELGKFIGDLSVERRVESWKSGKNVEMQINCSNTSHVSLVASESNTTWACKGEEEYQLVLTHDSADPINNFIRKVGLSRDQPLLIFQNKNNSEQKLFYLQVDGKAHKFYATPDGGVKAADREGRFILAQEYMKAGDIPRASAMLEEPWIDHETKTQTELSERENQVLQELIDRPGADREGPKSSMRRKLLQAQLAQRKYQATFLMKDAIVPDNRELHKMVSALVADLEGNKASAKPIKIPKSFRNQLADLSDYYSRVCSRIPGSGDLAEKLVPSNESIWAKVSVSDDGDIREAYQKQFRATSLLETLLLNPKTTIKKSEDRALTPQEKESRMQEVRPEMLDETKHKKWIDSSKRLIARAEKSVEDPENFPPLSVGERDQVLMYTTLKKREAELETAIDAERVSGYETPGGEEALTAIGDRMKVRLEQQLSTNKSLSINLQAQLTALASQVSTATGVETDADDLIVMIMHSSPHLKKLSADDQLKIQNLALRYLFVRTEMQQLRLMAGELKTNGLTADNRDKIGEILHSKREYDVNHVLNSPRGVVGDRKRLDTLACLFCEFNQGFRLRKDQLGYLKGMLNASAFDREVGRDLDLDLEKNGATHGQRLGILRSALAAVGREENTAELNKLKRENSEKVPPLSEGALTEMFLKGEIRKGWLEKEGEDENDFAQLAQMPTGFGKTDVFFITLALRNADGNTLVKLTAPDALKSINKKDMNKKLKRLFQNRVKEFTFEAGISKDQRIPYLKEKLALLESAIKNGHALITSPDSADRPIFALMKQMEDEGNNEGEAYGLLKKIVQLFHEQSFDIIDEADKCSDIHQKTNLVGSAEVRVSKDQMQIMGDVFMAASRVNGAISDKLGYNLETSYHKEGGIKEQILDSYLTSTQDGREMKSQADAAGIDVEDLKRYLTSRRQEDFGSAESFNRFEEELKECPSFGRMAYLNKALNNYFPNSQSNTNRLGSSFDVVHGTNRFATPCHNGEPDLGSKFEDPGETAAYTFQAYMQSQGLFSREDNRNAVMEHFVDAIVNRKVSEKLSFLPQKGPGETWIQAWKRASATTSGGLGDGLQALAQFADLIDEKVKGGCEDADLIKAQLAASLGKGAIKSMFDRANNDKGVVLKLVEHVILNEDLKIAPKSYEGNRDNRLSREGATLAFSATLVKPVLSESWNQMDSKMRPDLVLAQQEQIKEIGAEPCHALNKVEGRMAIEYFKQDLRQAASNLRKKKPIPTQMLVDAAGLWAGGEGNFNLTLAQEAYKELCTPRDGPQLKKFVVYYDTEAKSLMMLKHKEGVGADQISPVPFEKIGGSNPEDYFIILDQGRSTGTDTKAVQFEGHHEILTMGPGVTESDFLQAKGRSRMKKHSWTFSCDSSFHDRAAKMRGASKGPVTNEDILNQVFLETARQNNTDDFQSLSDELNSHVSARAREVLDKASETLDEDNRDFLKGFLGNAGPSSELANYFDLPREYITKDEKKEYLLRKYDEMMGKLVTMQEMLPPELRGTEPEMEVKSSQIGQLMTTLLQRKIKSIAEEGGSFVAGSMGVGSTVKQQQETMVQQQVTAQVQVETQVQVTNQVMNQEEVETTRKLSNPVSTHVLATDPDPEALGALRSADFEQFSTRFSVRSRYSDEFKAVDMARIRAPESFIYDHVDFEGISEPTVLMKNTFDAISRDIRRQWNDYRTFGGVRNRPDFNAENLNGIISRSENQNSAVCVEIPKGASIGDTIRLALREKGVVDEDVLAALREGVEKHFARMSGTVQRNRIGQMISPGDYKIVLLNPYANMPKDLEKFGLPKGANIAVSHNYKGALTEGSLGLKFAATCVTCGRVSCGCNPTLLAELEDTRRQIDPVVVKIGDRFNIMTREEFECLPDEMKSDVDPNGESDGRIRPRTGSTADSLRLGQRLTALPTKHPGVRKTSRLNMPRGRDVFSRLYPHSRA